MPAAVGYFAWGCFRYFFERPWKPQGRPSGVDDCPRSVWIRRQNGGRTRDRTLDLSRVKGTLSLVSPSARPKNRRKTAAYAAYDFVVSYAIDPKIKPSGTSLGPV